MSNFNGGLAKPFLKFFYVITYPGSYIDAYLANPC